MNLILVLFIFFTALTIHEFAHGWVALKRGDPTATYLGRLSLNPLVHIDPVGTVMLPLSLLIISHLTNTPLIIFGWAKPVPINYLNLRNPKRDMLLVGLAGPLANILFAYILSVISKSLVVNAAFFSLFKLAILINLFLAVFNLVPLPPLDGSRVVMSLLPQKQAYQYSRIEPFGFIIVIVLLYLGLIESFVLPIVNFFMKAFLG